MRNNIPLVICLLAVFSSYSIALNLPDGFNKVDQTYGDFDGANGATEVPDIYHDGIDLPGSLSQTVISPISSGTVVRVYPYTKGKGYICVEDLNTLKMWTFGHIIPDSRLIETSFVDTTTVLGVLHRYPSDENYKEYNHLHVVRGEDSYFSCNNGGSEDPLQYFTDSISSQALSLDPSGIMFTHFVDSAAADRSSLESKFPATAPTGEKIIYGDTDIIVFGRNSVNGGNKSGFYRIDYMIQNSLGETPVPARTAFVMGGEMDPSSSLLHTTYLAPPTSDPEDGLVDWDNYYNITNSGPALENVQLYSNTQTHAWQTWVRYGVEDNDAMEISLPTGRGGDAAALLNHTHSVVVRKNI